MGVQFPALFAACDFGGNYLHVPWGCNVLGFGKPRFTSMFVNCIRFSFLGEELMVMFDNFG